MTHRFDIHSGDNVTFGFKLLGDEQGGLPFLTFRAYEDDNEILCIFLNNPMESEEFCRKTGEAHGALVRAYEAYIRHQQELADEQESTSPPEDTLWAHETMEPDSEI